MPAKRRVEPRTPRGESPKSHGTRTTASTVPSQTRSGSDAAKVEELLESIERDDVRKFGAGSKPASPLQRLWQSGGTKVLVVVAMLFLLFVLKSGEDTYHSLVSSTHSLDVDPYMTLGVGRGATKKEIKKAHRELSLLWHPDKRDEGCDEECHQKFKEINEAYRLLSDSTRRTLYDQTQKVSDASTRHFFSQLSPNEMLFTPEAWRRIVLPSLNFRQLWTPQEVSGTWAFLVADPRSEITEHLLPIWSELALRFHGRVSFMRIDSTDSVAMKMLPVKLAITPAIMMHSAGGVPALYDKMHSFQPRNLAQWMTKLIPTPFVDATKPLKTAQDIKALLLEKKVGPSGKLPVIFVGLDNRQPPKVLDALANRLQSVVDWLSLNDQGLLDTLLDLVYDAQGLQAQRPRFKRSIKGVLLAPAPKSEDNPTGLRIVELSGGLWKLDKIEVRGQAASHSAKEDNPSLEAHTDLLSSLTKIIRTNEVPLFEEALPYLCPSSSPDDHHIVCALRAAGPQLASESDQLKNLARIKNVMTVKWADDFKEDVAEVDQYEDDDLEDTLKDDADKDIVVQALRIDTNTLAAHGSALVDEIKKTHDTRNVIIDTRLGTFQRDKMTTWNVLPEPCVTALGKTARRSWSNRFWRNSKALCAPQWRLSTRQRITYWCDTHRIITVSVVSLMLSGFILMPIRRQALEETEEPQKEE